VSQLIIPGAILALVGLMIGAAWWIGRQGGASAQTVTDLGKNTNVSAAMLAATSATPSDPAAVDRRLRDGSF
jgi:hypothetical protein